MARPLRIQFENAYYHITSRGNSRQKTFADDFDRKAFLDLLERSREIYQVEVLGYVLTANHFHLLIKTPLANLQEFMRHFNISYTSSSLKLTTPFTACFWRKMVSPPGIFMCSKTIAST